MISVLILGTIGWGFWQANSMPPVLEVPQEEMQPMAGQDPQSFRKQFTTSFKDPTKIGTLNVDIKRGSITVIGHDEPQIVVDLEVPNYASSSNKSEGLRELRPNNLDFDITANGNAIKVDANSEQYITNLRILVPRRANLKLDSYQNGGVKVNGVQGHLDVRSFYSDLTLIDCAGSADLYSYHGNLVASLVSVDPEAPLEFDSYNGSIDLTLPADLKADTQLRTGRGRLLTDFNVTEVDDQVQTEVQADGTKDIRFDKFVRGKINGGGPVLKIETEQGDIHLRKQPAATGDQL